MLFGRKRAKLGTNSHLQMSVISVGASSSLVSLGIMAKPPRAYRKPPMEIRLRELRSCGNSVNSDHLERNVEVRALMAFDQTLTLSSRGSHFTTVDTCSASSPCLPKASPVGGDVVDLH